MNDLKEGKTKEKLNSRENEVEKKDLKGMKGIIIITKCTKYLNKISFFYLFICLFVYLFVYLFIYLFFNLFIYLIIYFLINLFF